MVAIYMNKLVSPLFPTFCDFIQNHDHEKVRNLTIKVSKLILRFSLFFLIGIYYFNKPFIGFWVGLDKFSGTGSLLWILIFMFFTSVMSSFGIIIMATKNFKHLPIISIFEVVLIVITTQYFGKLYGFNGILGSFVICTLITQFYTFIISLNQIELKFIYFFKSIFSYALFPNLVSFLFIYFINKYFELNDLINFIIFGILFIVSHFGCYEIPNVIRSKDPKILNRLVNSFQI